ncbi:hypothetical protein ALP10_04333 [Pseudomonas syringae pv. helianthi]|uniref:YD repeat-containing protein n=1 Tax=Pseudomonas syringae pv. helianthi TaxID=251654 RepID=A0A3M6CQ68_9PSED|nr:RHS repeat-associated core domain-containing protein [Pseudomonas syringae group genomosp. 7]RMV45948.1 hypothetical protein ALP10_04333 [Pseudomonas syringae pv. helianthi]
MTTSSTTPMVIGRQSFDGLGRQLTVETGGRVTRFHYQAGQLPPAANTLADGKRLAFIYEPQLGNQLLGTQLAGQTPDEISYHPRLAQPTSATGGLGRQQWSYTPSGHPESDVWTVDDQQHITHWRYSLNGLLLGFDDATGNTHERHYDGVGRLQQLNVGALETVFGYDDFSRPARVVTRDTDNGKQLIKTFTYDVMGREHTRTFKVIDKDTARTVTQTLGYCSLDRMTSRSWDDGQEHGEETFAYDDRGRLIRYTADPAAAPADPFGNRIVAQVFTLNALDGYQKVVSHFTDGSQDEAAFSYAPTDPTRVIKVTHTHASWPARIDLRYDACGRVVEDSLGRLLVWDEQDRLVTVSRDGIACEYGYDPSGHLTDRLLAGDLTRSFFSGNQMTHEQRQGETCAVISDGQSLFALTRLSAAVRETLLLGTDARGSVRVQDEEPLRTYTPHGAEPRRDSRNPFGFAGERVDDFTGWYIPGDYRPYDPVLMCFLSPDSASPFGRGGLNPYAYCGGDPVNRIDPDGHSWVTYALSGIGMAIGAMATISTLGAAAPVLATLFAAGASSLSATGAMAIGAATLSAISLSTGIASMVLEATGHDQKAASILGWVSLGTGLAGIGLEMTPAIMGKLAARAARSSGRAGSTFGRSVAIKPAYSSGRADIYFERAAREPDVAFIKRIWNTDDAAFMTHGGITGKLMNAEGVGDSARNVARNLIAPQLDAIGYPANQKIVLLSCWGAENGAAQTVANVLKRPVQAYAGKVYPGTIATMQIPLSTYRTMQGTTAPLSKISAWQRIFANKRGPFIDTPKFELAVPKMFYPV